MSKSYKVLANTLIGGRYFNKDEVLTDRHQIADEDLEAAVAGKFVEELTEEEETEKVDAVPSELTTEHQTKKVVAAEKAGDKKAAQEG